MAEILLTQVFQQIQCTIPGHNEYKVSRICVDKDCKESNLICDLCEKAHKTHRHQLLSVAEVQESFIKLKNSNQANVNFQRLSRMVDDFETLATIKLKALVADLKQLLDVTSLIENSFVKNKTRSYSELQNQITQLLNYVELNDGDIQFKILQPSDIFPKIHDKLSKFLQEINNFWKKNTGYGDDQGPTKNISLQNQLDQFPQQQQMHQQPPPKPSALNQETKKPNLQQELDNQKAKEPAKIPLQEQLKQTKVSLQDQLDSYKFTPDFCSQQIKCVTPRCVQKTAVNIANDVACLNKPLSPYEKQSFVFRINRLKGYIGIGISIFWSVEANNFMFGPLDEVGHGVFMVLNNGLVYNNNYPKYNRITGQIEFREGQKYRLTFDPQNKEGKQFTIQPLSQNTPPYTMPMQIDEALDYHVFVYMGQRDGEVELLNEF